VLGKVQSNHGFLHMQPHLEFLLQLCNYQKKISNLQEQGFINCGIWAVTYTFSKIIGSVESSLSYQIVGSFLLPLSFLKGDHFTNSD